MTTRHLRLPVLLVALAVAVPAFAQTDPAIQRIRENSGVSSNRAAEQMMENDAREDARADRGEQRERETPTAAAPLPAGEVGVGDVQSTVPLEEGEEADPAADAEEAVDSDLPEL